ncbi:MAG: aldo/keto reductase [Calditrichales bacterium]|nr:MAG: aldo/keto reductase [Calditrichales bacterium]
MIRYRTLGKSGLKVSEIGLGCWAIGGPSFSDDGNPNGWAGNNDAQSIKGLFKAYELGINHWDSADAYGKGHSERLIGKVFREGVKREDIILATKIGWFKGSAAHPYEPLHVRHQLEQSLQNLNTDHVDIYYFHNPYFGENDQYLEPAAEMVHRMKEEGKIRVVGQSAYSYDQFLHVCPVTKPEVLQLPFNAMRSPFDTRETDIFKWADQNQLGVVMFGTYAMGLLLGKYDPKNPPKFDQGDIRAMNENFTGDFLNKLDPVILRFKERFGDNTEDLAMAANQYALSKSEHAVAIPGFKNDSQVASNFETMKRTLTEDDIQFISENLNVFKVS